MSDAVVDLTARAGLPVALDERSGALRFGDGVVSDPPGARLRGDLRGVLRDPRALDGEPDADAAIAYHLYRAVRRTVDEPLLAAAGLRHDLTVTLPGRLGGELVKTSGHYHPADPDSGVSFPELYEVVHGRAAFVLQRVDDVAADAPTVAEVWVQLCEAGERILIPPGCGHVTVNVGDVPLVVADLISLRCGHLYGSFAALGGAAVHVLADPAAPDGLRLAPNPAYGDAPPPRLAHGSRDAPLLPARGPSYAHLLAAPEEWAFLERPAACASKLLALWRDS